ncbi:hypothetical protein, partial [Collinsella tanakaei]|uniref:hypothetical protein n=1 Tax=Collinsella tanakaei TaxID=626935 RepID=UPI00265CE946
ASSGRMRTLYPHASILSEYYKESMEQGLQFRTNLLKLLGGTVEVYAACDTYQFSDYSKYHASSFDESHKRKVREEQFPKDLQAAFEIGCRLAAKA